MKRFFFAVGILICCFLLLTSCQKKRTGPPKVLVFSKTMGFKHASIPKGMEAITQLGADNGFEVDTTTNAELFNEKNLKQYAAIIFLSTTMNVLDHYQEAAFERYIQAGGGFVGIHAATDTEYDWGWYNKLVGAQFLSHPAGTPTANFKIEDANFIATKHFSEGSWEHTDEIYNYKRINSDVNVLLTVDEQSYQGGENGDFHPIAWYHEFDGGRAFYTGLGHTDESFDNETFLKHVLGGITYAIGDNLELDYTKATSQIPPDADRFSKKTLAYGGFFEPTEMTIFPNNDVLIAQRRGEILWYNNKTEELKEVAKLDVYHKTLVAEGVNAEEGLMGLQKDPNFATNHWVYVYYAPTGEEEINRLSRFKFVDGTFKMDSEQVILDVGSDREICCHTGGSIAFGPDDLLYLSTGDNSTPFDEGGEKYVNRGYAPLNDSPGHEQYDARRSSGNTNDLRGKILRIKVNEDGTYDIPKGNLFPMGTEKTRPEIYTMGHRNPYRISVDMKTGYVYWGDVGPDAGVDSLETRGPRGYDEMNQARAAGNFGWPLFIADNKPYHAYDYETGVSGNAFDPAAPKNTSRNNTGLVDLPPAMPAYAFYPYSGTQDFPQVGSGGRNAMAGPTYHSDLYGGKGNLPKYYDGKVIIYDWMRGWMKAVHLFDDGTFNKMEPFASDITVNSLIDMEVSPDGRIYLLEYGSGWFTQNEDSGLSYIEFNAGNRPPIVNAIDVDNSSGATPLKITATVDAKDRDEDAMTYFWDFGNGETKETMEPKVSYEYAKSGDFNLSVTVKDSSEGEAKGEPVKIVVGNSRPEVTIDLQGGNSSFFIPGKEVAYKVSVNDPDSSEPIAEESVFVSVDYVQGMDKVSMSQGHQQVSAAVTGKALTQAMDCKLCHKELGASIGPSYTDISKKYSGKDDVLTYYAQKIVNGGTGVWGEVMMPAHPDVTPAETRQIALYIASLANDSSDKKSLPTTGKIIAENRSGHALVITASYTDEGTEETIPLTGTSSIALVNSTLTFPESTVTEGMQAVKFNGMDLQLLNERRGGLLLNDIDLTDVQTVVLALGWQEPPAASYEFKIRLNDANGQVIGEGTMARPQPNQPGGAAVVVLNESINKKEDIYIEYQLEAGKEPTIVALVNATFN